MVQGTCAVMGTLFAKCEVPDEVRRRSIHTGATTCEPRMSDPPASVFSDSLRPIFNRYSLASAIASNP